MCDERICLVRGAQSAVEAKNTEVARCIALLIPMLPKEAGRDVMEPCMVIRKVFVED